MAIPSLNGVTADSITNAITWEGQNAGIQYNGSQGYLDSAIYLRVYFLLTAETPIDSYSFRLTYADAAGRTRTMARTS